MHEVRGTYMKLIAAILLTLLAMPVFAAEFTVDDRSFLHVGASTAVGAGIDGFLLAGNANRTGRIIFSAVGCMAVGSYKEFVVDSFADAGDMFFNVVGCSLGIGLIEGYNIRVKKNALLLEGSF